jgi:predicted heme/steroid binding protein
MASDVRERKQSPQANGIVGKSDPTKRPKRSQHNESGGLSVLDILRLMAGGLLLNCLLSYFITSNSLTWGWRPWFIRPKVVLRYLQGPVLLTDVQLSLYNGTDPNLPVYLALNGTIYDVSAGRRIYGPGGSYHVFAGKDAARGFVTGCFAEDSTPDLRGAEWTYVAQDIPPFDEMDGVKVQAAQKIMREQQLRAGRKKVRDTIEGWQKMFRGDSGKDYFEVGRVVREEGWLEKLPRRKLCAQAEKGRPKSSYGKGSKPKDAGEQYRGGGGKG